MKDHPILMNTEMVKATLEDRKNHTRRVINPQPEKVMRYGQALLAHEKLGGEFAESVFPSCFSKMVKCPYGKVGDLLYVRETWSLWLKDKGINGFKRCIKFKADDSIIIIPEKYFDWWDEKEKRGYQNRPSIHLPKWASRIWLKNKGVRVEKLQDISEQGAKAEGVSLMGKQGLAYKEYRYAFMALWDSINFKRGFGWGLNPYVRVVEFERIIK